MRVVDLLGAWLFALGSRLRGREAAGGASSPPHRILVIQLDHLGDAILSAGFLQALRHAWPTATIDVLASRANAPFLAASGTVQHVHTMRFNRFARGLPGLWVLSTLRWAWKLRGERYDMGLDVRGELPHAVLLWLAGIPRRVGWSAGGGGFLLTASGQYEPRRHELASRANLLAAAGITGVDAARLGEWRLAVDPILRERIRTRLDDAFLPRPLVVMHIGAGTAAKRWPVQHWRELIGRLLWQQEGAVILVGGHDERFVAREILAGAPNHVLDWTDLLSVGELAALYELVDVAVGADSGPAHLAAAVGTPGVVLFSGTNDPDQWRPWTATTVLRHAVACSPCHGTKCPLADHPCMRRLTPESVAQAVLELFPRAPASAPAQTVPIQSSPSLVRS